MSNFENWVWKEEPKAIFFFIKLIFVNEEFEASIIQRAMFQNADNMEQPSSRIVYLCVKGV